MVLRTRLALAAALIALLAAPVAVLAHGKGHVKGTVNTVDASSVDVKTADGKSQKVTLTDKTKYMKGDAAAAAADVKPGMRIVIHLADDGSAGEVHLTTSGSAETPHKH